MLQHHELRFKVNEDAEETVFDIVHNLEDHGQNIGDALQNWLVRTDKFNVKSFIEYVVSKDPENFFCVTKKSFDKTEQLYLKNNPHLKKFDLWMEGFAVTGNRQGAQHLGSYLATTFNEAVKLYMKDNPGEVDWDKSKEGKHSIWGCTIFDNEKDARKSFG